MKCPSCGSANLEGEEDCASCQQPLAQAKTGAGMQKKLLSGTVAELQPKKAVSVKVQDKVADVLALMRQDKIGCVLVMEGSALKGMLTERNLLQKAAGHPKAETLPVATIMRPDPEVLSHSDTVNVAMHRMAVGGYRHLPVLRPDGGYDILSARDFLRYLCK